MNYFCRSCGHIYIYIYIYIKYDVKNSNCTATYLLSDKPFKKDEQDILNTAEVVNTNLYVKFSHGLLHMDTPGKAHIHQLYKKIGCLLDDVPKSMIDRCNNS